MDLVKKLSAVLIGVSIVCGIASKMYGDALWKKEKEQMTIMTYYSRDYLEQPIQIIFLK